MGFAITYSETRPITGRWRGVRYGVSVCSGTYDSLMRVINQHCNDNIKFYNDFFLVK